MAEEKKQPDIERFKKEHKIVISDSVKHDHDANKARLTPEQSANVMNKIFQQMQRVSDAISQAPLSELSEQAQTTMDFIGETRAILQPLKTINNLQLNEAFLTNLNDLSIAFSNMQGWLETYDFELLVPYLGLKMYESGIDNEFVFDDLFAANEYAVGNTTTIEERLKPLTELVSAAREERDKLNEHVLNILENMKQEELPETFREYLRNERLTEESKNGDDDSEALLFSLKDVFFFSWDEKRNLSEGSLFLELIDKARAAYKKKHADTVVNYKNPAAEKVEYPIDKINSNVWRYFESADADGQLTFAVERHGSKTPIDITYSINFDELEKIPELKITKQLSHFDKRVYLAVSALFNQGYEIITISQIYATMGNTGRPNARDIKKISDSLTKMESAQISLDNIDEHAHYSNYAHFKYQGHLLLIERVSAVVNGQLSETAIHIFREPPLVTFAKQRGQITTFSSSLLAIPLNQTESNLQLEDYLFERIGRMKNSKNKSTNKILYAKIFEEIEATTNKQKSRTIPKINTILTSFKEKGYIKNFKETPTADGVTISY